MADILSFLEPQECLAVVEARRLMGALVNLTNLLAPKGYTFFRYRLGGDEERIEVIGTDFPRSHSCSTSDRELVKGKSLLHMDDDRCIKMVNSTLATLLPLINSMPSALLRCQQGPKVLKDWIGGRVLVTALDGGYRVQLQRLAEDEQKRLDNVFMLVLGHNPAYLTYEFIEEVPEVCRINHEMAQVMEERVSGFRGVHFDFISGVVTFKHPSMPACASPALPIRFLVAGVYDEVDGVFAWGWAVTGLPEHVRDEVAVALRDGKDGPEPHHAVFETPTLRCDARLALVLAGFVGHRLRHTHAGIYRHRDPKLQKVIYLAVENETDGMDCE